MSYLLNPTHKEEPAMICTHRKSLHLCRATYFDQTTIINRVSENGDIGQSIAAEGSAHFFGGTQVGRAHRDAAIGVRTSAGLMLAFRGTIPPVNLDSPSEKLASFLDWVNDTDVFDRDARDYPRRAHGGFAEATNRLWMQGVRQWLLDEVNAAGGPVRIIVTGHSKGGAMAYLAAWKIAQDAELKDCPLDVISFAAPRPGTSGFANAFSGIGATATRYEADHDIVPLLPPKRLFAGLDLLIRRAGIPLPAEASDFQGIGNRIPEARPEISVRLSHLTQWLLEGRGLSLPELREIVRHHGIGPGDAYDELVCNRDIADCGHI